MEAVWDQGQHFRTVREKLDKFSTGGVYGTPRNIRVLSVVDAFMGECPAGSFRLSQDVLFRRRG
jgi:hypothetical protein